MADSGISQELLDAIRQEMVGTYEVSEGVYAKLLPGLSRSPPKRHERACHSSSRRWSRSPKRCKISKIGGRLYDPSWSSDSSDPEDLSSRRNYGNKSKKTQSNAEPPPLQDIQKYNELAKGQTSGAAVPSISEVPSRSTQEENKLKSLMAEPEALSKVGVQLIRWAGFHKMKGNEFNQTELDTETCSRLVASFKCPLKPEHRALCLLQVGNYKHPVFKKPYLDEDFYQILVEKGAVADKLGFSEIINPLDKHLLTLQLTLLKSAHPMFVACNEFELSLPPRLDSAAKLFGVLERTVSLCRKTLVLLGQCYSLTSSFRQDRILETVGFKEVAPKPADFPNLEDSFLFGKTYMSKLKEWLEKSEHPVEVTYGLLTPEQKRQQVLQAKITKTIGPRPADAVAMQMIDYLVEYTLKNWRLKGTEAGKPQFWFLFDESSVEYKYYRLKLSEIQKIKQSARETAVQANAYQRSPEDMANESVRAMIMARKIRAAKKRFRKSLRIPKKKMAKTSTVGTQTDPPPSRKPRPYLHSFQLRQGPAATALSLSQRVMSQQLKSCVLSISRDAPCDSQKLEALENHKSLASGTLVCEKSTLHQKGSEVDATTKRTAENLARFLLEMGSEMAGFNLDVISGNPEFWFLSDKESKAYQYFSLKVTEFREAMGLPYDPLQYDNLGKDAPQDTGSKSSECLDPGTPPFKSLVPEFYDSDCEIIELDPQESQPSKPGSVAPASQGSVHQERAFQSSVCLQPAHRGSVLHKAVLGASVHQDSALRSFMRQEPATPSCVYRELVSQASVQQDRRSSVCQAEPSSSVCQEPELRGSAHKALQPQGYLNEKPEPQLSLHLKPDAQGSVPQGEESQYSQPQGFHQWHESWDSEPLVSYCSDDENSDVEENLHTIPENSQELVPPQVGGPQQLKHQESKALEKSQAQESPCILHLVPQLPVPQYPAIQPPLPQEPEPHPPLPPLPPDPEPQSPPPPEPSLQYLQCASPQHQLKIPPPQLPLVQVSKTCPLLSGHQAFEPPAPQGFKSAPQDEQPPLPESNDPQLQDFNYGHSKVPSTTKSPLCQKRGLPPNVTIVPPKQLRSTEATPGFPAICSETENQPQKSQNNITIIQTAVWIRAGNTWSIGRPDLQKEQTKNAAESNGKDSQVVYIISSDEDEDEVEVEESCNIAVVSEEDTAVEIGSTHSV